MFDNRAPSPIFSHKRAMSILLNPINMARTPLWNGRSRNYAGNLPYSLDITAHSKLLRSGNQHLQPL